MIYGSGLPYQQTLGPVLTRMGVKACVFGVPGNSPVDYLATLRFVSERIDPGAYVAFYLYAYNDFVDLKKYVWRGLLSKVQAQVLEAANRYDSWRKSTYLWSYMRSRGEARPEPLRFWHYNVGKTEPIKFFLCSRSGVVRRTPLINEAAASRASAIL